MSIGTVVGIALLTAAICLLLRQHYPIGSFLAALTGGGVLLWGVVGLCSDFVDFSADLIHQTNIDLRWFTLLIKVLGISYVCKFGADLCRDAGEIAVAGMVETAGKGILVALSLPYLLELIETITELIQQ